MERFRTVSRPVFDADGNETGYEQVDIAFTAEEEAQADADALQAEIERNKPPQVVSMRQARLALLQGGLIDGVDAAIAAMTGAEGKAAQIEWEYATEVKRDAALVTGMQAALGMTEAQIDDLFRLAVTL